MRKSRNEKIYCEYDTSSKSAGKILAPDQVPDKAKEPEGVTKAKLLEVD